ncbi:HNH endonuclease [Armatimonas sp.]|uniref:HNH endonuclease n=1 Tax=Armatimonas sp. TaxID=1872638 RepID=UPI003750216E
MISARLRRTIRSLYGGRCGYCGVSEEEVGAELTLDHFQPQTAQGTDALENLVYCCPACNAFKSDYWPSDPALRLLHPLNDDLGVHLRQETDGRLTALTEAGERQIERLHLNRAPLVRHRLRIQERRLEQHAQAELRRELAQISQRLQRLEERFS